MLKYYLLNGKLLKYNVVLVDFTRIYNCQFLQWTNIVLRARQVEFL